MRKRKAGPISRKARKNQIMPEGRTALIRIAKNLRAQDAGKKEIDSAAATAIAAMNAGNTMPLTKRHFIIRHSEKWLSKRAYSLQQRRAVLEHLTKFLKDTPALQIRPEDRHVFPDGQVVYGNFFVFSIRKKDFGLMIFDYAAEDPFSKIYFLIDTVQGIKGMNPREVQKAAKRPWFEAMMDHFVASCRPLVKARITIGLKGFTDPTAIWSHRKHPLYNYIIDRYFQKKPNTDSYGSPSRGKYSISYFPLNFRKARVKKLLGL